MKSVKVEIITIGDEILIGQIVDTKSAWMATKLNEAGFEIHQITSVHDHAQHITSALDLALEKADVVLITGGLGPTNDDITKNTLCKYFNSTLIFDASVLANIEKIFANRNIVLNELTRAQAMVPYNCKVIQNTVGTAPIMWFEKNEKVIISMPGVPSEMKHAMKTEIILSLQAKFKTPSLLHKTIQVYGYPESALAIRIADWENSLPEYLHLAYLPNLGIVKLRLSGILENVLELEFAMNQQVDLLSQLLGKAIVSYEDIPIANVIGKLLTAHNKTLSVAESCTGGNISHLLTTIPGSSIYFKGSVVAYSNNVKVNVLNVSLDDLSSEGAVSKSIVEQMAQGVRKLLKTDYAIATSGIAGPDGGTLDKPVGTVWISACSANVTISKVFHFGMDRERNIERASQAALLLLKEIM